MIHALAMHWRKGGKNIYVESDLWPSFIDFIYFIFKVEDFFFNFLKEKFWEEKWKGFILEDV